MGGRVHRLPPSSIVVRDPRLQLLIARKRGFFRIRNDVDDGDSVETDHLFEIDETFTVSVDVFERGRVVSAVRVGLEESSPFTADVRMSRHV